MLWPSRTNAFMRHYLFGLLAETTPFRVLDQWGQYKKRVDEIPDTIRGRIIEVAHAIVNSFTSGEPVRGVLVQGHADQDLLKFGEERVRFEQQISEQRAVKVMNALRMLTEDLAVRRLDAAVMPGLVFVAWRTQGLGATRRVKTNPMNEFERSLNRRVEIFLARSALLARPAMTLHCEHGGMLARKNQIGFPKPSDGWTVQDCHFDHPKRGFSPCITVKWHLDSDEVIDTFNSSMGTTFSADGKAQGTVKPSIADM